MTVPGSFRDTPLGDFAGRVRLRRRFGYPGRIDAHERVWLTLPGLAAPPAVALNGTPLGPPQTGSRWEYDITDLLRHRNELAIDLDAGPGAAPWGGAALEVRAAAFLRGTHAVREGDLLTVRGTVAGALASPLELYLVADRRPAGYAPVPPGDAAYAFEFTAPARDADGAEVRRLRVDLVCGAVIWYTFEADAPPGAAGGTE